MRDLAAVLQNAAACERKVLPSGLTLLAKPMPGYSGAHVIYATRFGSVDSAFTLDKNDGRGPVRVDLPAGVAHFLEHKMFESEEGDAFALYAKTGANANAYTSFDRTSYIFTATEKLDESLDVLLGMVGKPYFTEATIAKEQGIIGQEIGMYDDSADWRLLTGLCQCLYAAHSVRNDIAGTVESIAEITPEMLYACTDAFYQPANMVLAAAGNITMEQLEAACARAGLNEPRQPWPVQRILAEEPPAPARDRLEFSMPVSKPCLGLGFKEEPLPDGLEGLRGRLICDLLTELIVGGTTPLYRRLYDEGLVNPEFDGDFLAVEGCLCFAFTGESDCPEKVRELLLAEIDRLRAEGVDEELFRLNKNRMYGELIQDLEQVEDAAGAMANAFLHGCTVYDELRTLAALTKQDVDAALQTMLRRERCATVIIHPAEVDR